MSQVLPEEYYAGMADAERMEPRQAEAPVNRGSLAAMLRAEYEDAERSRTMVSERWLDDLRQYRGMYEPKTIERLRRLRRSAVFYRLTTQKVNVVVARLMDLLFPQRSKNWSIEPTPAPMIPDEIVFEDMQGEITSISQEIMAPQLQQMAAQGMQPDDMTMQQLTMQAMRQAFEQVNTEQNRIKVAKERAQKMERVIDDQLKECNANGQRRPSWQQNCREVVKSACLYGMGIMKGPLVEKVTTRRFRPTKNAYGDTTWSEEVFAETLRPYHEAVSIWDVFPDPGARCPSELRYVWQTHLMLDKEVMELMNFPGFNAGAIKSYMRQYPDGDADFASWETQTRDLNEDNLGSSTILKNRYRVYERWGFLSGRDLASAGADIDPMMQDNVFSSNVWMIGDTIIKAMVNPLEGVDIPYYFFPYQQDDTSFWPEGVACAMRAAQAGINSAVRAMQDNAAISCGPIIGVNMQAIGDNRIDEMVANKVFLFDRANVNLGNAFQVTSVPSTINENLQQVQFWSNVADEVSTPRFNAGDGNIQGAGQTASGLSMLMGASNINLKDIVKNFDDNVSSPFIRAMFRWNMQWNEDESIKGDFEITASGSQSLIAKEVRAQQIPALVQYVGVPAFSPYIDPYKLLRTALQQTDLPDDILRTEDEARHIQEEDMRRQAQMQAEAQMQQLMAELQKQGMDPQQIQQQILLIAAQLQGGQQAMPPQASPAAGGTSPGAMPDVPPMPRQQGRALPVPGPEGM